MSTKAKAVDRLPPHSVESEAAVLGCLLTDPQVCIPRAVELLSCGVEEFYDLRHQTIYATLVELWEDQVPVDVITIIERLKLWDKLEQVGGLEYISVLPEAAPSTVNLDNYVQTVREHYLLRRTIQTCTTIVGQAFEFDGDINALMDNIERDMLAINQARVTRDMPTVQALLHAAIVDIEASYARESHIDGIPTGFVDLDRITHGLKTGMYVIGGRPSTGKTSLAMNIVEHAAADLNLPTGVFSLEMTGAQLMKRMVLSRARVDLDHSHVAAAAPRITNAAGPLAASPIFIDDTPGMSILQLRAKARRMKQQHDIKLFVIDYMGLLNSFGSKRKYESREREVAEISQGIKLLSKELDVPIIALCQLNREIEKEKNRRPRMSDLRESGSVEADADFIGILYRTGVAEEEDDNDPSYRVSLWAGKNRNGAAGMDIPFTFFKAYTRFESSTHNP